MGRIHLLECYNFKSYKDLQVIGPFFDFQAVIGPNGSGKSNLMDAISFVLGVRTGQLRGNNLQELIYKGPEDTPAADSAYVKMTFVDDNDKEFVFQRTIKREGKDSKYTINGKKINAEDYDKRLKDFGILVKAKNFLVFQGDVETLASKSPKDLTAMFEQISGSSEYRDEYEELASLKTKAEEETIYNYQKKKGANAEKKQLKIQKKEAEDFQGLKNRLTRIKQKHVLFQLFHMEKELKEHGGEVDAKQKQLEEVKTKQKESEKELKEKNREQAKHHKEALILEGKIRAQSHDEGKANEIKTKEEVQFITQKIKSSEASLAKINEEYKTQSKTIESLRANIEEVQEELKQFKALEAKQKKEKQITLVEDQIAEYNSMKEKVFRQTAQKQQQLTQYSRLQKQDQEQHENLSARLKELESRKAQLEDTIKKLDERKSKINDIIEENTNKLSGLKQKLTELSHQSRADKERQTELTSELERIQGELHEAKADRKQNERETKFSEAVESLKRLFSGVYGRLTDLAKISKKYRLAVTVAAGGSIDAIIVEDEKTALECIRYFKDQRIGTATFIPLDKIKVKPINEKLRLLGGTSKPVVDVVQYDPAIQKAILYAFGSTLVCETLNEARRLAYDGNERHRVVTVDGTIIEKSGLMSGGLTGLDTRVQRWDEREIAELKRSRDRCLKELAELGRNLRSVELEQQLNYQISTIENTIKFAKMDLEVTDKKIRGYHQEIKKLDEDIARNAPAFEDLEEKIEERNAILDDIKNDINSIEDNIFKDFSKEVGVKNIREYEENQLKQAKEQSDKRVKLATHLSKLQNQVEYELKRDLEEPKKKLEDSIAKDKEKLKELKEKEKEYVAVSKEAQKELEKLMKKHEDFKSLIEEKEIEIKEYKKRVDSLINEGGSLQKQITSEEGQIEKLQKRRQDLLQRCRVEEIILPKKSDKKGKKTQEEAEEEEEEEEAEEMEVESQTATQEEKTIRTLDFSSIKDKEVKSQKQYEKINQTYIEKIQSLSLEIEKLNPNLKATEKLGAVSERLDELNKDWTSAKDASDKLTERFNEVKQLRHQKFMDAFSKISKTIDEVYKSLTNIPASVASLTLENPEEPYLEGIKYNAIPPNKRFRDMDQLSGGEKTLAALALLFAIHSYQPSPFFVLDEVDAALDPVNVTRIVNYIRKRSSEVQCIVISLKHSFFEMADALIGIYRDDGNSSRTLTLDLKPYAL